MVAALGLAAHEDARPLQVMLNAYIQATTTPASMDVTTLENALLGWTGVQVPDAALRSAGHRVADLLDTAAAEPGAAPASSQDWYSLMGAAAQVLRHTFDLGTRDDGRVATSAALLMAARPVDVLSSKAGGRTMCRFALRKACQVRARALQFRVCAVYRRSSDMRSVRAGHGGAGGGARSGKRVGGSQPFARGGAVGGRDAPRDVE